MEELTCYLDDLTMTKVKKITKMSWCFQKKCSSEAELYLMYQKNRHNRMKG